MKRLLLAVFLLSLPASVLAQQGATSGLQFVAPMQIAIGTDNNFLVDRTDPNEKLLILSLPPSVQPGAPEIRPKTLDDKFFLLTLPKIGYLNDSRRHELTATWVPEFEIYKHNGDQNSINHQGLAAFSYFLSRNMRIAVADTYKSTHDPARTIQNVFLLLPRSRYQENAFRGSFDIQTNALTAFSVQYDHTSTRFGNTDPFQARILDANSSGYTFKATRMVRRNHRLRGIYSMFKISPIDRAKTNDDAVDIERSFEKPIHSGTVEYRMGLARGTIVEVAGGLIGLDTGLNYTFRGSLDKRLGTYYWLGGTYARTLRFSSGASPGLASGLASDGFYDVFVIRFNGQPSRKTNLLFDTTFSRSASGRLAESSKAFMGRTRFDYRLNDRNVLFASLEAFHQNQNLYVQTPLSRTRFTMGIEISLSSEVQRRTSRLNEDGQYVALTEHDRQRGDGAQED